jgi:hypothetical protein
VVKSSGLAVSIFAAAISLAGSDPARADVVTDWNQTAVDVLKAANVPPAPASRSMAMVHVAMSDAVNSVQGRYARYSASLPSAPGASAEAAAASAARQMLLRLYPGQKTRIEEAYAASLKTIPDGAAKDDGVALGERAAGIIYADRSSDATDAPDTYRPITTPGVWIPTTPPAAAEYAQAKPWVMKSADQFRPGPPPPLSSALYARDYNETKNLGGAKSTARTADQTEAVRFWNPVSNPGLNHAARQLAAAKGLGLADNARLFALFNMSIANTYIADWDAKFHYNFWRPITAIRNGDLDGNDVTERDPGWTPLLTTPMHPEYPSQAAIMTGAARAILESVFGSGPVSLTVTNVDPRLQRQFNSVAHMAEEIRLGRIWAGMHFRNSLSVSDEMGRKIAVYLLENSLQPAR